MFVMIPIAAQAAPAISAATTPASAAAGRRVPPARSASSSRRIWPLHEAHRDFPLMYWRQCLHAGRSQRAQALFVDASFCAQQEADAVTVAGAAGASTVGVID